MKLPLLLVKLVLIDRWFSLWLLTVQKLLDL